MTLAGCGAAPTATQWRIDPLLEAQASGADALFIGLSVVDSAVAWASGTNGRWARTTTLISMAERAGFVFVRDAALRPWLWPPAPRASIAASSMPVLAETPVE